MAEFVELSKDDHWAMKWGGVLIRNELDYPTREFYDHMATYDNAPELHVLAARKSVAPLSESPQAKYDRGAVADSLIWPIRAFASQHASPFVAAGVAALVLVPIVVPAVGVAASLLSGYTTGASVYYFMTKPEEPNSHSQTGSVEQYVIRRNTEESAMLAGVPYHYFFALFITLLYLLG
jgi:hypothetical protein